MIPKYRAFIIKEKRMVEVDVIDFKNKRIQIFGAMGIRYRNGFNGMAEAEEIYQYYDFDDIVLMLSTPRKDSSKSQVFEGDIVQYGKHNPTLGVVKFYSAQGAYCIIGKEKLKQLSVATSLKIMGNIHEHPHLLEH